MLYAKFFTGDDRYIIAINQITVITPYVNLKPIPSLPDYAAGLLNYRGQSVPVIDLCQLLTARSCVRMLSSRIIITTIKSSKGSGDISIGFLVENATETFSADDEDFIEPGMKNPELPFIVLVVNDDEGMLTRVSPQDIFENIDEGLFFPESASERSI